MQCKSGSLMLAAFHAQYHRRHHSVFCVIDMQKCTAVRLVDMVGGIARRVRPEFFVWLGFAMDAVAQFCGK